MVHHLLSGCPLLGFCRGGILQVLEVFLMLGYGYYNVGHIDRTEYIIETDKISDDYRVVFIGDTHYGTVQNPAVLQELMAEIGTLEPDFIVPGGDIVEGGTSRKSMKEVSGQSLWDLLCVWKP